LAAAVAVLDVVALFLQRDHAAPQAASGGFVLLVAALFFGAERFPIHVRIRTERHTLSFNELALAFGLVYLTPIALTTAILVGGGGALIAHRHQRGVKLSFNGAQLAAQAIVAVAVFGALDSPAHSLAARALALAVAVLVADLVSMTLVSSAIALFVGSGTGVISRRVLAATLVETLAKCAVAIVAVLSVLWYAEVLGIAIGATAAGVYLLYRRRSALVSIATAA
jgi:hypothetical protein